jgi:hypothetical protein
VTTYISLEADELSWPPGSPMPITLVNLYKPAPEKPVLKVHSEQIKCGFMKTKVRHYRITFNKTEFYFGEPIKVRIDWEDQAGMAEVNCVKFKITSKYFRLWQ